MKNEEIKLYGAALALWGDDIQLLMLAEECAELATAVMHFRRKRKGAYEELVEEIADVSIMVDQCKLFIGTEPIENAREKKLVRLARLIEAETLRKRIEAEEKDKGRRDEKETL